MGAEEILIVASKMQHTVYLFRIEVLGFYVFFVARDYFYIYTNFERISIMFYIVKRGGGCCYVNQSFV